jgi:hypothetical protein
VALVAANGSAEPAAIWSEGASASSAKSMATILSEPSHHIAFVRTLNPRVFIESPSKPLQYGCYKNT